LSLVAKDEVQRGGRSRYFVGSHGKYAAMGDFDVQRKTQDLVKSYPDVSGEVIEAFVPFAVYLYYLR